MPPEGVTQSFNMFLLLFSEPKDEPKQDAKKKSEMEISMDSKVHKWKGEKKKKRMGDAYGTACTFSFTYHLINPLLKIWVNSSWHDYNKAARAPLPGLIKVLCLSVFLLLFVLSLWGISLNFAITARETPHTLLLFLTYPGVFHAFSEKHAGLIVICFSSLFAGIDMQSSFPARV